MEPNGRLGRAKAVKRVGPCWIRRRQAELELGLKTMSILGFLAEDVRSHWWLPERGGRPQLPALGPSAVETVSGCRTSIKAVVNDFSTGFQSLL